MHELQTWKIHAQGLGEPGGGYPQVFFFFFLSGIAGELHSPFQL